MTNLIAEVPGLYQIDKLDTFRKTPGVIFDEFPMNLVPCIDAIDRVIHMKSAHSPGPVGDIARPWYMHRYQTDHLLVMSGSRDIELCSVDHGKVEIITLTPNSVYLNGELLYDGGAVVSWPRHVFHRVSSGENGSASINFATHYDNFDINTNFDIYDLDVSNGSYRVIRKGFKDQEAEKAL